MSFLGGLIGGIAGFITGGPAGAVVGAAGGLSGGASGGLTSAAGYRPTVFGGAPLPGGGGINSAALPTIYGGSLPSRPFSTGAGIPMLTGGAGFAATPAQATGVMTAGATSDLPTGAAVVACDIKGHHLNKSHYFTKPHGLAENISHWGGGIEHEKGSTCVKNRRMNVTNPHALRRALRRARGFEKLAMRTIRILHPTKRGRFAGFKTRRRSR